MPKAKTQPRATNRNAKTNASRPVPELGKQVVLPSSFRGGPREMAQSYQDAMALVRKFGFPDLFITMTANPAWQEIANKLRDM